MFLPLHGAWFSEVVVEGKRFFRLAPRRFTSAGTKAFRFFFSKKNAFPAFLV
jgi:hypothetical protein